MNVFCKRSINNTNKIIKIKYLECSTKKKNRNVCDLDLQNFYSLD